MHRTTDVLRQATAIADGTFYAGYLRFPYRAGQRDRGERHQLGVLVPPGARRQSGEHDSAQTECLLLPVPDATLRIRLRFLQAQSRGVELADADGRYRPVPSAWVAGTRFAGWDEAVEREVDVALPVAELPRGVRRVPFTVPGGQETETLSARRPTARLVRRRWPISGALEVGAHRLDGPHGALRLRVEVHNDLPWRDYEAPRDAVLRRALLGTHVVLVVTAGRFLSMLDPPAWAGPAARDCVNVRAWPVLVGDPRRADAILSAPSALSDYPACAPRPLVAAEPPRGLVVAATTPAGETLRDRVDAAPPRGRDDCEPDRAGGAAGPAPE
ncbi:hypothetical protein SAMN05444365_10947 [Micromonospora pattaloongensis]|uniref:Uncharacterized protein n=1 Tax=Micromonospora pattaloongensis TaxID=405436 RepID=A0A1H3RSH7_9ACTN|nr:hypothetical protein [Micromonospora pattaloongensis]SDZ28646.1 hypothetical protein SAMN05444365_10947 [Micromonospora pattaloongensis]